MSSFMLAFRNSVSSIQFPIVMSDSASTKSMVSNNVIQEHHDLRWSMNEINHPDHRSSWILRVWEMAWTQRNSILFTGILSFIERVIILFEKFIWVKTRRIFVLMRPRPVLIVFTVNSDFQLNNFQRLCANCDEYNYRIYLYWDCDSCLAHCPAGQFPGGWNSRRLTINAKQWIHTASANHPPCHGRPNPDDPIPTSISLSGGNMNFKQVLFMTLLPSPCLYIDRSMIRNFWLIESSFGKERWLLNEWMCELTVIELRLERSDLED